MVFIWMGAVLFLLATSYVLVTRDKPASEWDTVRKELQAQRLALEESQRLNEALRIEAARPAPPSRRVQVQRPFDGWQVGGPANLFTSSRTTTTSYDLGPTVPEAPEAVETPSEEDSAGPLSRFQRIMDADLEEPPA